MADFADRAAIAAERHLKESLAAVAHSGEGSGEVFFCVACGDDIPEGRRKARPGVTTCIACQELIEGAEDSHG